MYSPAYNLWTFTWFVHFELPFRLKDSLNSPLIYILFSMEIRQGKLISVVYSLLTYWNQFSHGGVCKQEKMHQCYSSIRGGSNHVILSILIMHRIVFYDQNISLIFYYVKDRSLVRLWHPSCVYFTPQRQSKMRTHLK